jgi:hypothetical protein
MTNAAAAQIVRTRMVEGNDHVKDVAKTLKLTPGQTAFIKMQILVEDGTVKKITGTPAQKLAKIVSARKRADEYSSWGWLAARSEMSEGTMKKLVAEKKSYPVFGERIATIRAAKRNKK